MLAFQLPDCYFNLPKQVTLEEGLLPEPISVVVHMSKLVKVSMGVCVKFLVLLQWAWYVVP